MTQALKPVELSPKLATKSGRPLSIGVGTGTKVKDLKRADASNSESIIQTLQLALDSGFFHVDTAECYTTHPEVAEALRRSSKKREDLFVVTKYIPPGNVFFEQKSTGAHNFVDLALEELGTDYLDAVLLHHPFFKPDIKPDLETAWKDLIEAKKLGKVRHIGVSNFRVEDLKIISKISAIETDNDASYQPAINQIEFHPYLQEQSPDIVKYCQENNILVEAYGPLTPLFRVKEEEKDHPLTGLLPELSAKYGRTPAQILLRYTLQKGILPITTSSKEERIKQSLEVFDFSIDQADVDKIDSVGSTYKLRTFFVNQF